MLQNYDTISTAHTSQWYAGGGQSHSLYGNTFDIDTGNLLDSPYDMTNKGFVAQLYSVIPPHFYLFENNGAFFMDDKFVYIITSEHKGGIIKWNGKFGGKFEAEALYVLPELIG